MEKQSLIKMEWNNVLKILEQYKEELIQLYNSKIGNDKHTLQIDIVEEPDKIYIKILGPEEIPYIENGRGPGKFPPPFVLQEWVQEKLGVKELPKVKSLAFLIGKKISEKGLPGKHILLECFNELNPKYEQLIIDAENADAEAEFNKIQVQLTDSLTKIL